MTKLTVPLLTCPAMGELPGVVHGFSTRDGGVSTGPRSSLNLAIRPDSDPVAVEENWRRVSMTCAGWSADRVVLVDQVHGREVMRVSAPTGPIQTAGPADAMLSTLPGLLLAVRTADCVPVLLAGPGGVAAAHAGWRGLVHNILPATVRALCDALGCAPHALTAVVGPHIGVAAYEVGPEVVQGLVDVGLDRSRVARMGASGREHADLGQAAKDQLSAVDVGSVHRLDPCTYADPRFFSHRRDGASTGRLAAVIGMQP